MKIALSTCEAVDEENFFFYSAHSKAHTHLKGGKGRRNSLFGSETKFTSSNEGKKKVKKEKKLFNEVQNASLHVMYVCLYG